jgi:hypothetical protein
MPAVVRALFREAKQGKTYAAWVLGDWITRVMPESDDEVPEGVQWHKLTPSQKAAYRARLDELLAQMERAKAESADKEPNP